MIYAALTLGGLYCITTTYLTFCSQKALAKWEPLFVRMDRSLDRRDPVWLLLGVTLFSMTTYVWLSFL